jgi:dsDNA-binding SOS-regulon protein
MLDSGSFENKVWGALHKAWKGYVIAKNKDEYDKMLHYADIIQECQHDLRLEVSSFHNIGKSALAFYSLRAAQYRENMANKNNNYNNNNNQEQLSEENEVDQQYEHERFTDEYSEYFEDDENKADRFNDDYHEDFTD